MLHEAQRAQDMAAALDERGVYVAGFFYPVVPKGKARIRTQMSAALTRGGCGFRDRSIQRCGAGTRDCLSLASRDHAMKRIASLRTSRIKLICISPNFERIFTRSV